MINEQVGELHHITSEWSIDIQIGKSQWRKIHYEVAFELTSYFLNIFNLRYPSFSRIFLKVFMLAVAVRIQIRL